MFNVFIACLIYLSHVYLYFSSRHYFLCMLSDSDLLISMYLLHFGFTVVPLISFMLLVIACTYMPEPHHLIMYTCAWYERHLALLYVLTGCIWQPWILMSRSRSLEHDGLAVDDQSAQRILPWQSEGSRSLDVVEALPPSSSSDWLSGLPLLPVSTLALIMYISSCIVFFCISSDVIFL